MKPVVPVRTPPLIICPANVVDILKHVGQKFQRMCRPLKHLNATRDTHRRKTCRPPKKRLYDEEVSEITNLTVPHTAAVAKTKTGTEKRKRKINGRWLDGRTHPLKLYQRRVKEFPIAALKLQLDAVLLLPELADLSTRHKNSPGFMGFFSGFFIF